MIYLRLSGGLGNQLYQLAATALLSQLRETEVIVSTDALQGYETPREPDSIKLLSHNPWLRTAKTSERNIHHWLSVNARAGRFLPVLGLNDKNFWSKFNATRGRFPLYVDGYFQHGWTQVTFSRATSIMHVPPIAAQAAERLKDGEIAIHIRGGDFLKLPRYQVVHVPFYMNAVSQAMVQGFTRFAVITDDPPYATVICQGIQDKCVDFSFRMLDGGANALEDFDTLRSATGRIIGNSTFAWWAAALSKTPAPTWAPRKFTLDKQRDFYLPHEIAVASDSCTI